MKIEECNEEGDESEKADDDDDVEIEPVLYHESQEDPYPEDMKDEEEYEQPNKETKREEANHPKNAKQPLNPIPTVPTFEEPLAQPEQTPQGGEEVVEDSEDEKGDTALTSKGVHKDMVFRFQSCCLILVYLFGKSTIPGI